MPEEERKEKDVQLMRMKLKKKKPEDPDAFRELYIQMDDEYNITGEMLQRVYPAIDDIGGAAVGFEFKPEGGKRFGRMTSLLAGKG